MSGDVYHVQHGDFADRARQFAQYVRVAVDLGRHQASIPQAFALLRSAMEHWAVDSLMMLGDRFARTYPPTSEEELAALTARWRNGDLPSIVEEPTFADKRGRVRIVYHGLTSKDGEAVLHPSYFAADQYDPFYGTPEEQAQLSSILDADRAREHAVEQRQRHNTFYRWGSIQEGLVLNGLVEEHHVIHLDVHYRFLSAFVHSFKHAHDELARNIPAEPWPGHSPEELAVLYAAQFAGRYGLTFVQMTKRPPVVGLENEDHMTEKSTRIIERARHLWFLEDEPDFFDCGQEVLNRRVEQLNGEEEWTPIDPTSLGVEEIRYYRNPLKRLRNMHISGAEVTTGVVYVSPWT